MAKITEDYVSFEIAQLLKEKGFEEWCCLAYGISVRHNGEEIDEDEEYELKVNGKEKEIEYIEGGHLYRMHCNNGKDFSHLYACPTQALAMKWLREVHQLHISVDISPLYGKTKDEKGRNTCGLIHWYYIACGVWLNEKYSPYQKAFVVSGKSNEEVIEKALRHSLENLI